MAVCVPDILKNFNTSIWYFLFIYSVIFQQGFYFSKFLVLKYLRIPGTQIPLYTYTNIYSIQKFKSHFLRSAKIVSPVTVQYLMERVIEVFFFSSSLVNYYVVHLFGKRIVIFSLKYFYLFLYKYDFFKNSLQ